MAMYPGPSIGLSSMNDDDLRNARMHSNTSVLASRRKLTLGGVSPQPNRATCHALSHCDSPAFVYAYPAGETLKDYTTP